MADRRAAAPAAAHGVARRLLVFKLPDQLTLCVADSAGDVRVLSDRYQRRTAGQARAQSDALLLAAAVLQRDFHVNVPRIPSSQQVRTERRQRLQYVRALLFFETRTDVKHVLAESISLFVVRLSSWSFSLDCRVARRRSTFFPDACRRCAAVESDFPGTGRKHVDPIGKFQMSSGDGWFPVDLQ